MPKSKKIKKRKSIGKKKTRAAKRAQPTKEELYNLYYEPRRRPATAERIEKKAEDDEPPTAGKYPGPRVR